MEIRQIFEGERVDREIESLKQDIAEAGGVDDAMGSVVPRPSDLEKLEELEAKYANARRN